MDDALTDHERARYERQMAIAGWGEQGQARIRAARVFLAGAGGLGSPAAAYLAAAGVGELRLCDADRVELSNLNRQILHCDERLGWPKADSARQALAGLNPAVRVAAFAERLEAGNLERLVGQPDAAVDCLDNFETRYLLNEYCAARGIPLVHGAVWGLTGQVTFLRPPETPCLRCLFPQPPPAGAFPVLGATAGLIGCLQALEVLKHLAGIGAALEGRLLVFDGEDSTFASLKVKRNEACPVCGRAGVAPAPR